MKSTVRNNRKQIFPALKDSFSDWFENILFVVSLSIIALRCTFIETPLLTPKNRDLPMTMEGMSLILSAVLVVTFAAWLIVKIVHGRFRWSKTKLFCCVVIFCVIGILNIFSASDKRAAMTQLSTLVPPMLIAVMLSQILDRTKIRIALLLVMALAVTATYQCYDQFNSNKELIRRYEANPGQQLQTLGIVKDSLSHFQYEHRLYSQDIRGFLLTSNSTATFLLFAGFATVGLLAVSFKQQDADRIKIASVVYGLPLAVILAGLYVTKSKGGIGAAGLMGLLFLSYVLLRRWMDKFWKLLLFAGGFAGAFGFGLIVNYGLTHGRLPGGNSMLVRWQYWVSSVAMIKDHLGWGVGGGNFSTYYPTYKAAAASEMIMDPHCWPLSLLCQFGMVGTLIIVAVMTMPIISSWRDTNDQILPAGTKTNLNKSTLVFMSLVLAFLMLFVRPILIDGGIAGATGEERAAAYVILYIVPAFILLAVFLSLVVLTRQFDSPDVANPFFKAALSCGVLAVLIHNLVDFAIFEPGNWGLLWLLVAILCRRNSVDLSAKEADAPTRSIHSTAGIANDRTGGVNLCGRGNWYPVLLSTAVLCIMGLWVYFCVVLPAKAGRYYQRAMQGYGEPYVYLQHARQSDPFNARYALAVGQQGPMGKQVLTEVIQANPAWYVGYEALMDLAIRGKQFEDAYAWGLESLKRFPMSDRIAYKLAQTAEKLGRSEAAIQYYQLTVDIEEAYRHQFEIMYPRLPLFSRLGEDQYQAAQNYLLSKKPHPHQPEAPASRRETK